jgi:LuxR family maltose regulon positive regulatory protein
LAASVWNATHGYALAVRAMLLAMARSGSVPVVGSLEWRQLVATDLRSTLPDEAAAEFVAATSVPPYFDADLAAAITGRDNATRMLELLEEQGFGRWIPYARQHPVFQYVDSIRDAFVAELRGGSEAAYRRAAALSARWLFSCGDHEAAFDLALEARDYPLAVKVYVDMLREYPECYLTDRLIGPLSSVPVAALQRYPMLAFALGLARWTHPVLRASAPDAFALSVGGVTRSEIVGPDVDGFVNRGMRAVSLRLIRRFSDAARSSRAAIAELDRLPAERLDELSEVIAMILRQLSYCLLLGGSYDEALEAINRSAALTKVASTRNFALAYAVGAQAFVGDLPAARSALARIDPGAWPRDAESSYLNAMTRIGEGFLQLDEWDFAAALDTITGSPSFTETTEFWPLFTLVATYAQLGLGQGLSAARWVEAKMNAAVPQPGVGENTATRALLGAAAMGWLAGGRVGKAERVLEALSPRAAELAPARMLHLVLTGRASAAVERLSRLTALPRHTVRSKAATLVFGAAAARRTGDERLAAMLAAQEHDIHRAYGVRAHLAFLPAVDREGLAEIAERSGDISTAAHLRAVPVDVIPAMTPQVMLTGRERAVFAELVAGSSRNQIATGLGVSTNTVKTQLRSLYRKLGVSSREAAISAATEYELLEPGAGQSDPVE